MNYRMLLARAVFCGLGMVGYAFGGVINGGFETGDFTGWEVSNSIDYTAVTNITTTNSLGYGCSGLASTCPSHDGSYAALFGNDVAGAGIQQSFATDPGVLYVLSFWLTVNVDGHPGGNSYKVFWDSAVLADVVNASITPWQQWSFLATGTGAPSVLRFEFVNSPDAFLLDDVSVAPAPEPVSSILTGTTLIALAGLSRLLRRSRR